MTLAYLKQAINLPTEGNATVHFKFAVHAVGGGFSAVELKNFLLIACVVLGSAGRSGWSYIFGPRAPRAKFSFQFCFQLGQH